MQLIAKIRVYTDRIMGRSGKPRGANLRAPAVGGGAPALAPWPMRLPLANLAPSTSRINLNYTIKVGLIRRPTFI